MSSIALLSADDVISLLSELAKNKNYVFRGYGKQSELFPQIIRDSDYSNQEMELLIEFEKYGLQYFSVNNAIDFLSYAQHFGLPTRLLDFTYNPFIALFFALYMPKSSNYTNSEDKDFLKGKPYTRELYRCDYDLLSQEEKVYREICWFSDQMNNIGIERVELFWQDICDIDLWSDLFIPKGAETKSSRIREKFSPVYYGLTTFTTLNSGFGFQMIYDFRENGYYDAETIFGLRKDMISHIQLNRAEEFNSYLHETLWVFRSAFMGEDRKDRQEAMDAFMKGTPYYRIR